MKAPAMTDAPETTIDPKRPWITDPRDAPSEMSWFQSFTDPFGKTSRVHFTRGWTALFFTRLIYFVATLVAVAVFASAGVENPNAFVPPSWVWELLIVFTAILSLVLHVRRLSDAGRSPLWATLVMVPIVIGFVGLILGMQSAARNYTVAADVLELRDDGVADKVIALRLDRPGAANKFANEMLLRTRLGALENPEGALAGFVGESPDLSAEVVNTVLSFNSELGMTDAEKAAVRTALEERAAAQREEMAEGGGGGDRSGRGGRGGDYDKSWDEMTNDERIAKLRGQLRQSEASWKNTFPNIDVTEVSQREHAFEAGVAQAQGFWMIPAFFVMLWSLLWVGRLPNGGGTIKSRFEADEVRAYQ